MSYAGPCYFCGEDVDTVNTIAYPVTGWEFTRDQGGANVIHGRRRLPDAVAHKSCAERAIADERRGIHPGQESLL